MERKKIKECGAKEEQRYGNSNAVAVESCSLRSQLINLNVPHYDARFCVYSTATMGGGRGRSGTHALEKIK